MDCTESPRSESTAKLKRQRGVKRRGSHPKPGPKTNQQKEIPNSKAVQSHRTVEVSLSQPCFEHFFRPCFRSHDEARLLAFEALRGSPRPARGQASDGKRNSTRTKDKARLTGTRIYIDSNLYVCAVFFCFCFGAVFACVFLFVLCVVFFLFFGCFVFALNLVMHATVHRTM